MSFPDTYELMQILKRLLEEKKEIQKRLNVLEEIVRAHLPIIEKKQNNKEK